MLDHTVQRKIELFLFEEAKLLDAGDFEVRFKQLFENLRLVLPRVDTDFNDNAKFITYSRHVLTNCDGSIHRALVTLGGR